MNPSRLMTVAEVKRDYRYSHTGVYREINAGHFEAIKRGRSTYIIRDSIERHLAQQPRLAPRYEA